MKVRGNKFKGKIVKRGFLFALSSLWQMSGEPVEMGPAPRGALGSQHLQTSCSYHRYNPELHYWIPTKDDRDKAKTVIGIGKLSPLGKIMVHKTLLSRRVTTCFANRVQKCCNYRL